MSESHDHEWLLARERGEPIGDVPPETVRRYARLERMLAELPGTEPAADWQQRVLVEIERARPSAARRSRVRYMIGLSAVAAAALIFLAIRVRETPEPSAPSLTTEVIAGSAVHRGGEITIGDTLVVKAQSRAPAELRVYGDAHELVARCGVEEPCYDRARRSFRIALDLRTPGAVRAVLFIGPRIPASGTTMAQDLEAATRAKITTLSIPPIIVQ